MDAYQVAANLGQFPFPCHSFMSCKAPVSQLSSILFGGTMVPNIEQDYILLLGYSILYKEYNLTRFNHQKNTTVSQP